jgi:hypothetical protein
MLKIAFFACFLALSLINFTDSACYSCPDGWKRIGRFCLKSVGTETSFDAGKTHCINENANATLLNTHVLSKIENKAAVVFLQTLVPTGKKFFAVNFDGKKNFVFSILLNFNLALWILTFEPSWS